MQDLRRGLHLEIRKRNFTSIPGDQPQKALRNQKTMGAFHALDTHDLRRRFTFRTMPRNHDSKSYEILHWPRRSILKLKFQNCNPSQDVTDSLHLPCKQNEVHVRKRTRSPGKTMPSKLRFPGRKLCASLHGRNQHRISKRHSCRRTHRVRASTSMSTRP